MADYGSRIYLEKIDGVVASSYDTAGQVGGPRATLQQLGKRSSGRFTRDTCTALVQLHLAVLTHGGDFRVTDGLRPYDVQAVARRMYEAWLAAGKPRTAAQGYNPARHKAAFVAKPGYSFHNAGRAVDVDLARLGFPNVDSDHQLDVLWGLAVPLGFRPAIKAPDERASEAWHLDYMGPWAPVFDRLGYEQTAMCAVLDVGGHAAFDRPAEREVQAQLHRAGYDVGAVDGVFGPRTGAAVRAAGVIGVPVKAVADLLPRVRMLPDSATVIWAG